MNPVGWFEANSWSYHPSLLRVSQLLCIPGLRRTPYPCADFAYPDSWELSLAPVCGLHKMDLRMTVPRITDIDLDL